MKNNEIKAGAILSYVILFLNTVIGLAYTPFLIRVLGQSEYGLYSLVSSVISYLTVLDLGFGNAIIIYTARYRTKNEKEKEQKLHGMFLIIYTIIGFVASIIGIVLFFNVENMFGNTMNVQELETAKTLMIILTVNLVVTFPFSIFTSIITAYEKFIFSKVLNIIRTILNPLIMLPLLLLGYKSITMVLIITLLNIVTLISNMFFCIKKLKIKLKFGKFDTTILKEIFAYSFYIFLNAIIDKVNWNVDQFVLGTVSGTIAVAIYAVAAQLNHMYLSFSTGISGVLLPKITAMEANNATDKEFTDVFIRTGRIQYLIMALIVTGFVIFGQQFINIWAGENYSQAYIIACILMVPVTIPLIQNVGLNILQAKNKYRFRTLIFFVIAIANVIISIPLAKMYEGIGSAIGTAISLVIGQIIIMNIYYYKKINIDIPRFWKEIIKMSVPIIIIAVISYITNIYTYTGSKIFLVVKIIVYTLIYILCVWKFSMNNSEKNIIKGLVNKFRRKA